MHAPRSDLVREVLRDMVILVPFTAGAAFLLFLSFVFLSGYLPDWILLVFGVVF